MENRTTYNFKINSQSIGKNEPKSPVIYCSNKFNATLNRKRSICFMSSIRSKHISNPREFHKTNPISFTKPTKFKSDNQPNSILF